MHWISGFNASQCIWSWWLVGGQEISLSAAGDVQLNSRRRNCLVRLTESFGFSFYVLLLCCTFVFLLYCIFVFLYFCIVFLSFCIFVSFSFCISVFLYICITLSFDILVFLYYCICIFVYFYVFVFLLYFIFLYFWYLFVFWYFYRLILLYLCIFLCAAEPPKAQLLGSAQRECGWWGPGGIDGNWWKEIR